jgi:hypothetical protein
MTTDARTTRQIEPVAVDLLDYHQRAGTATRVILRGIATSLGRTLWGRTIEPSSRLSRPGALGRTCILSYGEVSVVVPVDSDTQTRLLAMLGRDNLRSAALGRDNPRSAALGRDNPRSAALGRDNPRSAALRGAGPRSAALRGAGRP